MYSPDVTVEEFMMFFVEPDFQKIKLYDFEYGIIFEGYYRDLPDYKRGLEVSSVDNIEGRTDTITINVIS